MPRDRRELPPEMGTPPEKQLGSPYEKRIAELEAERDAANSEALRWSEKVAGLETAITDVVDDVLGLQEVVNDKEELLSRLARHDFEQRRSIEALRAEVIEWRVDAAVRAMWFALQHVQVRIRCAICGADVGEDVQGVLDTRERVWPAVHDRVRADRKAIRAALERVG